MSNLNYMGINRGIVTEEVTRDDEMLSPEKIYPELLLDKKFIRNDRWDGWDWIPFDSEKICISCCVMVGDQLHQDEEKHKIHTHQSGAERKANSMIENSFHDLRNRLINKALSGELDDTSVPQLDIQE